MEERKINELSDEELGKVTGGEENLNEKVQSVTPYDPNAPEAGGTPRVAEDTQYEFGKYETPL